MALRGTSKFAQCYRFDAFLSNSNDYNFGAALRWPGSLREAIRIMGRLGSVDPAPEESMIVRSCSDIEAELTVTLFGGSGSVRVQLGQLGERHA
jgi:hypothetical protein